MPQRKALRRDFSGRATRGMSRCSPLHSLFLARTTGIKFSGNRSPKRFALRPSHKGRVDMYNARLVFRLRGNDTFCEFALIVSLVRFVVSPMPVPLSKNIARNRAARRGP